jgi:hypothetical protein
MMKNKIKLTLKKYISRKPDRKSLDEYKQRRIKLDKLTGRILAVYAEGGSFSNFLFENDIRQVYIYSNKTFWPCAKAICLDLMRDKRIGIRGYISDKAWRGTIDENRRLPIAFTPVGEGYSFSPGSVVLKLSQRPSPELDFVANERGGGVFPS